MNSNTKGKCQLCGCECVLTLHHLVPVETCRNKYKKVRNEDSNHIMICRQCHDAIHSTYDNNYLRDNLNTIDSIKADEKIMKFVRWKMKHPDFEGHSKMSNEQKLKNRR